MWRRAAFIARPRSAVAMAAISPSAMSWTARSCSAAAADDGVSWAIDDDDDEALTSSVNQLKQNLPPPPPAGGVGSTAIAAEAARTTVPSPTSGVAQVRRRVVRAGSGAASGTTAADDDIDPEWQRCTADELVLRAQAYLHGARDARFEDRRTEQAIAATLIARATELSASQILDLVEARWPRETRERHFDAIMAALRARLLGLVADYEAHVLSQANATRGWAAVQDEAEAPENVPAPAADLTPLLVARCIVVMGLRGGRRRDLELFRALGQALALVVNDIKDPHTLCYVLIAFQSARIRPPDSFLGLVGRRFPVLNKKAPMAPLPAFRGLVFYDKSEYALMNPYRFLADRVMDHIKDQLKREGRGEGFYEAKVVTPKGYRPGDREEEDLDALDFDILKNMRGETDARPADEEGYQGRAAPATVSTSSQPPAESAASEPAADERRDDARSEAEATEERVLLDKALPQYVRPTADHPAATSGTSTASPTHTPSPTEVAMSTRAAVRERFARVTQLSPPQLTKMLLILGRRNAPRQQYLRPIANDLLVPSIEHFNPPSFSRLIRAMRSFQSEELPLIEKIIDVLCERGPEHLVLGDLMDMLFLLSRPNTPLVAADKLFDLCRRTFEDGSRLRPRDMLMITSDLLLIRKLKFDEAGADTPAFRALTAVVDGFAARMAVFLELGLLEPAHADALLDMCAQLRPAGAEPSDAVARLMEAKRAALADGDEQYHELVSINVREIFERLQGINSIMTHRGYRPVNALTMQQFKALLDFMRADDILEAVHLYEHAYPRALSVPVRRVVGMFVVDKLALELKVLSRSIPPPPPPPQPTLEPLGLDRADRQIDGHRRVYAPYDVTAPKYSPLLFKPASLAKFANIVLATPLARVQKAEVTWRFLDLKARQFESEELKAVVEERLATVAEEERQREMQEMMAERAAAVMASTDRAPRRGAPRNFAREASA